MNKLKYSIIVLLYGLITNAQTNSKLTTHVITINKIQAIKQKLDSALLSKDTTSIAINYTNLANEYTKLADFNTSINLYYEGLKWAEFASDSITLGIIYYNISTNYSGLNKIEDARKYSIRASAILLDCSTPKDTLAYITLGDSYNMIASLCNNKNGYNEAIENFNKAEAIYNKINRKDLVYNLYQNRGSVELDLGNYSIATKYFEEALDGYKLINDSIGISTSYINLSSTIFNEFESKSGNFTHLKTCISYLDSSFNYIKALPQTLNELNIYLYKSIIYKSMNQFDSAYSYHVKYHELNDVIFNVDRITEIENFKLSHELKLKELENKALNTQFDTIIADRKIKRLWVVVLVTLLLVIILTLLIIVLRYKLKRKNREREVEQKVANAQMDPHFIFNAINSVQEYILKNDSEKAHNYLAQFAKLIRAFLNNNRKNLISLQNELNTVLLYTKIEEQRLNKSINIEIDNQTTFELDEIQVPPGIIQPIIENSIWHGFVGINNCIVKIIVTEYKNFVKIQIKDNGIGCDFQSLSIDSKGLKLVEERLILTHKKNVSEKLFSLENNINEKGVTVMLILPVNINYYE